MITAPSPTYLQVLRHSHESHVRVTLYKELVGGARELVGELPVVGVTLTYDGKAQVHRSADIEYGIDPWDTPSRDVIEQISTEAGIVTIEHGVSHLGVEEVIWVLIATLRVDSVSSTRGNASRTLYAFDRAILTQEHLLETVQPLNDTYIALIQRMLSETLPVDTLTIDPLFTAGELALTPSDGKSINDGVPRLTEMQNLADVMGGVIGNEPDGNFIIRKNNDFPTPEWDINEGVEGVLIGLLEESSRREQFNAVSISWTPDDTIPDDDWMLRIFLWDDDPASPTYYDGPFGKRPIFFDEEYDHLPSTIEAEALARTKLAEYTGATRSVGIDAVYNPLLEPGDGIRLGYEDGYVEDHVIDAITLELGGSARMSITTRMVRAVSTGMTVTGSAHGVL